MSDIGKISVMKKIRNISTMKKILLGYCVIILLGTLLLMLPISSKERIFTSPVDSLFTATSATCVTGLVRFDTYQYWSFFGQIVILALIQIGGIGFMTLAISLITLTKRKIGLSQRVLMQESVAMPQLGGIVKITKFIFMGSMLIEAIGAFLLSFYFIPQLGIGMGIFYSIFHSISAFCNAGFDLMGYRQAFSSLTSVQADWYFNLIIMLLIIVGGLGFFVWNDIVTNKGRFKYLRLHSKIVLTFTAFLIISGALIIFLCEIKGTEFQGKSISEKILNSLFQSVTARTAGFNTVNLANLTHASQFLIICLMIVGGSPGSTAGGIKTTTFVVFLLSIISTFKRKKSIECFRRRIDDDVAKRAFTVVAMYLVLSVAATMAVSAIEGVSLNAAMFECVSAIATVGLTLGITPGLSVVSEIILVLLMIFGRVGSLTILFAFSAEHLSPLSRLPQEKIQIG